MSAVVAKSKSQTLLRVRKAASERAEVITPFQYYSEVGETIFALHFSSHVANAKIYLHFDARQKKVAQLLVSDEKVVSEELEHWLKSGFREPAAQDCEPEDFSALLTEMHLFASQLPTRLAQEDEVNELRKLSKKAPVVIGGCGRSGTTLLLAILGAHPAVLALPEEVYAFYPRPFRLSRLSEAIRQEEKGDDWQRWCEKTPKNVRAFAQIEQLFAGEVRLVHIVRNGRDVVTSHHPNDARKYYISPERWVADVRAGLEHKGSHLIHYEDLVQETGKTLQVLCEFIGEEFDQRMLSYENHSSVRENKAWDARQASPLNSERVERWRDPEHAERNIEFMETPGAVELMQKLGYE